MGLNQNQRSSPGDSAKLQPPVSAAQEVNLYDELVTFSDLSPEERRRRAEESARELAQRLISTRLESATPDEQIEPAPRTLEDTPVTTDSSPCFGKSGPLGNLNPEFPFTGSLSAGICLGCGAESESEDLFCASCGTFVDEVGTKRSSNSKCAECGMVSSANELFCSGCGAVLTSA